MGKKDDRYYMSSVKLGPKGQIVIPKEARAMFGLEPGDTLVLLADTKKGIALQTADKLNPLLRRVVDTLVDGTIESDAGLTELHGALLDGASWHKADHYFLLKDFASYLDAKLRANRDYQDRLGFGRKCLKNIAAAGTFSSDRTVRQYAEDIWHI